ncbi:MAG TPA: FlgD immunoglobulin-like domain containing protein [Candidatus Limnocylindrales bacterium]|nr:FlgD immunoglobulin-like domain containing protein [Candidatus Limnocylindrales bacterium]
MHRVILAALVATFLALSLPATPVAAASKAKVVVIVGPVGSYNAHYKADANDIVAEAKRYTSNVVKLFTPYATWSKVKAAAQDANILVYLGHGNGWPSKYAPFQTQTKNGFGLDPSTGADGVKTVYYGEEYIRSSIRLAPNSVVLLYHLCYASGNTEPGLPVGSFSDSRERVDNYGAGFIGAGARAVFAEGHPSHPATNYMRQLFTTSRSMDSIFRSAPTWNDNLFGPYPSQRTPGLRYQLDPDSSAPSGFYRSLIGDLSLTAGKVTRTSYPDTGRHPADFVAPGAAEVVAPDGVPLFDTAEAAADPTSVAARSLPAGTKLRLAAEGAASADGTRIFEAAVLGATTAGYLRAIGIAPRDSAGVALHSFDESNAWLSPNDDGLYDGWAITARLSEVAKITYAVKNAAGTTVKSGSLEDELARVSWNLRDSAGALVPDGSYTWAMRARDAWGNATASRTGSFTVDGTPPTTRATPAYTEGANGWIVSPVDVTLTAKDTLSGVKSISWRVNGGTTRTYDGVATMKTNGVRTFEYRATDKAGIRESWRSLTFRIDTADPVISASLTGTKGDVAGAFRGPVTVTPTFSDATSGVVARTVAVDGGDPVALTSESVRLEDDGTHDVVFRARDAAGNKAVKTFSFVIDTVAPSIVTPVPAEGAVPPTVTPNGDGVTETVVLPFSASEKATVKGTVLAADGITPVRTFSAAVDGGDQSVAWDGRDGAGKPVPDGAYTITLTGRDAAGNVGPASDPVAVNVYGALAALTRTPTQFFAVDGDTLAPKTRAAWMMVSPATVTVTVRNAAGEVVRTAYTDRALPAGAAAWSWNGMLEDGTRAPRGRYRVTVAATNGTQASAQAVSVLNDAFKLTTSVTSAIRGKTLTITARTTEALSTTPFVQVYEPGLASRNVTMTKVSSTTWTAKITPKTTAQPGTLTLKVRARDSLGGTNWSSVKLPLE